MTILLTLGGITFDGFEIPEQMPFGGEQRVTKHKLVGGARQLDVMGSDQDDFTWSGRFRGASAVARARALDQMRIAGQTITLSWDVFTYQVVISQFRPVYQRGGIEIPYTITCIPSTGEAQATSSSQTVDNLVSSDLGGVSSLLATVTQPLSAVTANLSTANSLISAIGTLSGQSIGQTSGIVTALGSAKTALDGAVEAGNGNLLAGVAQIAALAPSSASVGATAILSQISTLNQLYSMKVASGLLGRSVSNLSQAASST